ncbi:MAG: GNAT family N-acetyltransferase, partial [Betaproteobacteria bacterium AqS2]|nr:GNAT family N-acetyltransferase [Betaproteobacteria bacterium AqS2]
AREEGCCKVTLEVLERNAAAQALYAKLGYGDVVPNEALGRTLHWDKKL